MAKMTKVILLIESSRAFGRRLLTGIGKYCRLHGAWTFYHQPGGLKDTLPQIKSIKADGIITRDCTNLNKILKLNLPVIVCQHTKDILDSVPNIVTDSAAIGKLAAEHFLERGFHSFAFCGFSDLQWSQKRCDSFKKSLKKTGYNAGVFNIPQNRSTKSWQQKQKKFQQWLMSLPKPVGVFSCNDDCSYIVLQTCKTADLKVPDQVAILGVDNDELTCDLSNPQLSSISLNVERAGYEAAKLLNKMMNKKSPKFSDIIVKPMDIIVRQSTDMFAIQDKQVSKALRFIHNNCRKAIQVDDVAAVTSISRRWLEKRFRSALDMSIGDAIRKARVEQIANLLVNTHISISNIAELLDYPGVNNVARTFRREKNMSPLDYRKKYGST